jgi:predicted nucleic acid-binding protein
MIAVDTSVAVAAFGEWHELNRRAMEILDQGAVLPAHALLETYSVLTGFPPPHRAPQDVVTAWLESRFEAILPSPGVDEQRALVRRLTGLGRTGGAVYDALVGLTVKLAGATLVTADRRAVPIYEALGVSYDRM